MVKLETEITEVIQTFWKL